MDSSIGVIIGVIVLFVSIGFVVLMMVSEWSSSGGTVKATEPIVKKTKAARPVRLAASKKKISVPKKSPKKAKTKKK
ncbi:MAG: hypothetical protein ACREKE_07050 [bacterium]